MGPIRCSETLVRDYPYWLRNDPEERSSRPLRGGRLRSRTFQTKQTYFISL